MKAVQFDQLMPIPYRTIHIHAQAPQKPDEGLPCNGCGVCCLVEPCPLGVLLSGRRHGACDALRWSASELLYRCGAISDSEDVLGQALPAWARPIAIRLSPLLARVANRWVAAGQGCDSALDVTCAKNPAQLTLNAPTISPELAELSAMQCSLPANCHDKPTPTS